MLLERVDGPKGEQRLSNISSMLTSMSSGERKRLCSKVSGVMVACMVEARRAVETVQEALEEAITERCNNKGVLLECDGAIDGRALVLNVSHGIESG